MALGWLFFWMAAHSRSIVIEDTYQSSSNLALSVEQFVARTMETVDLSLRVVVEEIGPDGTKTPAEIHRLLAERLRRWPQITGLAILDAEGRVRVGAGALGRMPAEGVRRNYFAAARGSAALQFTVEAEPAAKGRPLVFASRRFTGPNGRLAGVAVAAVSSDYMQQFFSTLHVGEHGIIGVETTDGTMLVRQPYREGYIGRNFGTSPLFREWLPWVSSGVFVMPYKADGLLRIIGYQRVEKLPLVVQVALGKDEALAHWRRTTIIQGLAAFTILMLAGITAYLLHRELQARLRAHHQLRRTVFELEAARFAAEESNRVKSRFLANMSHELRTPLNAVIGYSEMLLEEPKTGQREDHTDDIRRIHTAGRHLLTLVNDVLDVSALEIGRLELNEDQVSVVALVKHCCGEIARRAKEARLDLAVELPVEPPTLVGDEQRLRQIVLHLLSNAVKFTPPGGRITVSAVLNAARGLDISVIDTGIGMKPEEIPRALEQFRQLDDGLNRRYEGTGLGLPLARHLAELHGGSLSIESAPNRGTRVTFSLPPSRVLASASPMMIGSAAQ